MEFLFWAVLCIGIIYCLLSLAIHRGLSRRWQRTGHKPQVTVLIAARNEARNLPFCLDHLAIQDYDHDRLQVLILDDQSVDATGDIGRGYADRYAFMEYHEIVPSGTALQGKMNALAQGMVRSKGEIILVTDADCRPASGWIANMVSYFTEETAMVGGLTVLDGKGFFSRIQTCDWLFLQAVAAGTTGLGLPVSILGNNFGFRKSSYLEVGGFEKLGFSLTEDLELLRAVRRLKHLRTAYPLRQETIVMSRSAESLAELFHQRLRWIAGGRHSGAAGWLLLLTTFLLHLLLPVMLLLNFESLGLQVLFGAVILLDLAMLGRVSTRAGDSLLSVFFPFFEIYYFIYTTFFGLLSLFPVGIQWKGRRYN